MRDNAGYYLWQTGASDMFTTKIHPALFFGIIFVLRLKHFPCSEVYFNNNFVVFILHILYAN